MKTKISKLTRLMLQVAVIVQLFSFSSLAQVVADTSFAQIRARFQNLQPDNTFDSDYNRWKRYEAFWRRRLGNGGLFRPYETAYRQYYQTNYGAAAIVSPPAQAPFLSFGNWQELGPNGINPNDLKLGRTDRIQVDPDDVTGNTIYAMSRSGIYKTSDGGQNWINYYTDQFPVLSFTEMKLVKDPVTLKKYLYVAIGGDMAMKYAKTGYSDIYSVPFYGIFRLEIGTTVWQNLSGNLTCQGMLEQKLSSCVYKILVDPANIDNVFLATSEGIFYTCNAGCTPIVSPCGGPPGLVWKKSAYTQPALGLDFDYSDPTHKSLYCSWTQLHHTTNVYANTPFTLLSSLNTTYQAAFNNWQNLPANVIPLPPQTVVADIATHINITTHPAYPNNVFMCAYASGYYLNSNNNPVGVQSTAVLRFDKNSANAFPGNFTSLTQFTHSSLHMDKNFIHISPYNTNRLCYNYSFYGGMDVLDVATGTSVYAAQASHMDPHDFDFSPSPGHVVFSNDGGVFDFKYTSPVNTQCLNGNGLNISTFHGGNVYEKGGQKVIGGFQDNYHHYSNAVSAAQPWDLLDTYAGDGDRALFLPDGQAFYNSCYNVSIAHRSASGTPLTPVLPPRKMGGVWNKKYLSPVGKEELYFTGEELYYTRAPYATVETWNVVTGQPPNTSTITLTSPFLPLTNYNAENWAGGNCYQNFVSDFDMSPDHKTIYALFFNNAAIWLNTCQPQAGNFIPCIKTTVGGKNNPNVPAPCTGTNCWTNLPNMNTLQLKGIATNVVMNPANPNQVWIGSAGYESLGSSANTRRVVYSADGGLTFSDFSAGLPDFSINALVARKGSNYELYAATDIGVYYRNESMSAWQRVGTNFPAVLVYDLQIDLCNNKLYAYTFGRGLWAIDLPPTNTVSDMPVVTLAANTTYTGDQYFLHSLKVPAGVKLSVTNANVRMGPFTKIEVEPGGVLEVNNSTIQSYCDYNMWTGIVAKGVASQPQSHSAPNGGYLNHGYVVISNNAKLKDAEAALSSENGGVVVALNSRFENNRKDVQFLAYAYPNHQSVFVNCVFETNAQLKAVNNTLDAHVSAWAVDNVKFQGCTFQNIAPFGANGGYRGNGIYSIDATCNLISYCAGGTGCAQTPATAGRNLFKNLNYGVYAETTVNPLLTYNVVNSDFDGCNYGAYFKSVDLAGVQYCNFTNIPNGVYAPPGTPYGVRSPYGLYYDNCQNFFCEKNTFKSVVTQATNNLGLVVNGAGSNATRGYYCDFTDLKVGSAAYYDNYNNTAGVGLRFNCNQYKANGFDVTLLGGTQSTATDMDHVQGSFNPALPTFTNTVRNLYSAVCLPGANNQWFDDRTTAWSFLHANHSTQSGNGGTYFTAPQNGCYAPSKLTPQYVGGILSRLNVCPVSPLLGTTSGGGSGGGGSASAGMSALTQSISSAEQNVMALTPVSTVSSQNLSASTQGAGSGNAAPSPAQAEQAHARTELQRLYTQKLRAFVSDSMYRNADSVQVLLQKSPFGDKEQKRLAQYLHTRRFTQAQALLNTLQNQPGLSGYAQLKQIQLNALQQPNGLQSIKANAALKAQILQLARADFDAGQKQAQSLAKLLWNEPFYEPILLPEQAGSAAARIQQAPVTETVTEAFTHQALLQIVPNPSAERTAILYRLPEGVVNGQIVIQNELGEEVHRYEVIASLRQLNLTTATLHNGIYLVTLICGDKVVKSEKLIVNK
ncbi:MAG: hypothetical protein QM534_11570 [Sediminibacterium sp.]|nr:hypothetical protein [Sediminibacterium sp.]